MDKQTKQLIFLGALVVVAGIVAFFMLRDDTPDKPPANTDAAGANNTAAPQPAGGQPAGGPGPQVEPRPNGAATADDARYAELPPDALAPDPQYEWKWLATDTPFDPMRVKNIDVVDPKRQESILQLRRDWVLVGITVTMQDDPVLNEEGERVMEPDGNGGERPKTVYRKVAEAWFKGRKRPYKEKDRLTNTRFQIEKIFITPEKSGVKLKGDTGAELEMVLAPPNRFEDDFTDGGK